MGHEGWDRFLNGIYMEDLTYPRKVVVYLITNTGNTNATSEYQ